jgi:Lar family restriction alleviation protein
MITETTAPDAALLPCPFCGGAAYTVSTNDERMWFAGCRDCYCNVGESYDRSAMPEHMFSSEEEAIAAWNRRAGQAHDAGLLEALDGVMIGGNHLALLIGADHPPHEADTFVALEHYGAGDTFEIWCCWRAIMRARAAIAAAKGADQ